MCVTDHVYSTERLLKGDSISSIIEDVRHSSELAGDPQKNRSYWITRRDLLNVALLLNINAQGTSDLNDKNEVRSVEVYPAEIRSSDPETDTEPDPDDVPHIAPAVTSPGRPMDGQRSVVTKLGDLLTRADAFQGQMSEETYQTMTSCLKKMEQALEVDAAAVGGPEIRPALPASSDTRPSTFLIKPRPSHRVAPPETVWRPGGSTPRQAIRGLVSGELGLDKFSCVRLDHTY